MRRYIRERDAYTPRGWPTLTFASIVAFVLALLGAPKIGVYPAIVGVVVGILVGYGSITVRWWIWRQRHPVRSEEQIRDALRRSAPYN